MNKPSYIKEAVIYSLAFLILPNLVFFALGELVFMERALFNLDYLALGFAAPWIGRILAATGFSLIMLVDVVFSFSPIYYFNPKTIVPAISNIFALDPIFPTLFLIVIVVTIASATFLSLSLITRSQRRTLPSIVMSVLSGVVIAGDVFLSANELLKKDDLATNVNIAYSTLHEVSITYRNSRNIESTKPDEYNVESASGFIFRLLENDAEMPDNIVLIVIESYGKFITEDINKLQLTAIDNSDYINNNFIIEKGDTPFFGSTVPGELRELCRIRMATIDPDPKNLPVEKCLPDILGKQGYETTSIHGFFPTFFGRWIWYPALKFNDVVFAADIEDETGREEKCGVTFKGSCDKNIIDVIANRVKSEGKNFIYWLTLNAHLPSADVSKDDSSLDCSAFKILESAKLCNLVRHHDVVFRNIAQLIDNEKLSSTAVIFVGDHAPHYITNDARSLFYNDIVPYIILWPK